MSTADLLWRSAPARMREWATRQRQRGDRRWAAAVGPLLAAGTGDARGTAARTGDARGTAAGTGAAAGSGWRTQAVALTSTSMAIVTVDSPARRYVVKIAWTAQSAEGLCRHIAILTRLRGDPRLHRLHPVMPRVVATGEVDGRPYCVEQALPGVPANTILAQRSRRARLLPAALEVIGHLHARTGVPTVVDDATVEAWVGRPLRRLEAFAASRPGRPGMRLLGAVYRLGDELVDALSGRTVRSCWIHGDFWPGNLLAVPTGAELTGVVDWDRAEAAQLALHDLLHLHVLARRLARGEELGDVVLRALRTGVPATLGVPIGQLGSWLDGIPQRPAVLLYWLRHIVLFIDSEGHHDNRRWLRGNVERVLSNL